MRLSTFKSFLRKSPIKILLFLLGATCIFIFSSCNKITNSFMRIKAETAYNQGQYEAAIEIYKELIKKDPKDPMLRWHLGIAYYSNEDLLNCRRQAAKLRTLNRDDLADDLTQLVERPR